MITKLIKVWIKPGHRDEYLAAQEIWNQETSKALGYLGCLCTEEGKDPRIIYLHLFWRSRGDLERWMATDHDRIAVLAKADDHYERIETHILEDALPAQMPAHALSPADTLEAADVQAWSDIYRASAALRTAVRLALFDKLSEDPRSLDDLAVDLGVNPQPLEHLLLALCAMGLVARGPGGWANTGLAERTLVSGSPADQRDMVLHNTQPEYVGRVFSFGERLGLPPDRSEPEDFHPGFLKAMSNTAAAGQADALVAAVDLTDCRTLLDVGGATGPYAIALCRAYPNLSVAILDQPATIPIATPILESSGLAERIRIEAHDYRSGAFPGPVDAMLISNVLRGESQEAIDDILARAHAALSPGGHLLIVDLFLEDPPAGPGLSAALFGLHVPDGANYSFAQMVQAVQRTGFQVSRVERLTRSVVMNGIVEAVRT